MRCIALAALVASAANAQAQQPEVRVDVLEGPPTAVQPGLGLNYAMGYYVRAGVVGGFALEPRSDLMADRWRADVLARVTLDPFRQHRFGVSIGGGLAVRRRTYLLAVIDIEGPATRGYVPALQIGVGGGLRGALILRRARDGRR